MKLNGQFSKIFLPLVLLSLFFTSCEEMNSKMDEQLQNINQHAADLDSVVNQGLDQIEKFDSTITAKPGVVKDLDSLVRKTSTRVDSIVKDRTGEFNRRLN